MPLLSFLTFKTSGLLLLKCSEWPSAPLAWLRLCRKKKIVKEFKMDPKITECWFLVSEMFLAYLSGLLVFWGPVVYVMDYCPIDRHVLYLSIN